MIARINSSLHNLSVLHFLFMIEKYHTFDQSFSIDL